MVAYGAAMLSGVALSRALTRVSVARARSAGFEMLWNSPDTLKRVTRGVETVLRAELRNRDNLPTRFRNLQVAHSPSLDVTCFPQNGEVPARGKLTLTIKVRAQRVGFHGLHNITLQTIRAPGLYTVPLSFSNPFVLEVLPKPIRLGLPGASGGRTRSAASMSRAGRRKGEGTELRELREHRPGDPYKKIAWKASARRGRLLIIEKEQEQSDVVWLVMDASVDSASGAVGLSALDRAIDEAVSTIDAHLARGDSVGLALLGTRNLAKIPPGRGPRHAARLISALTLDSHTADADRSDWDESDVARRALEHIGSIDGRAGGIRPFEYEKIAQLAQTLQAQAPAQPSTPWSASPTDRILRRYLLAFGIQPPPRSTSDRHHVERNIASLLVELQAKRPRPTLIYLFGRPPTFETPKQLLQALKRIPKKRTEVRFHAMLDSVEWEHPEAAQQDSRKHTNVRVQLVRDALVHRQRISAEDGIKELLRLGVKTDAERYKFRLKDKLKLKQES